MSQLEVNSWEAAGGQQLGGQLIGGCPPLCPTLTLLDILDIGIKIRLSLTVSKITICAIYSVYLFIYFYGCEINNGIIYAQVDYWRNVIVGVTRVSAAAAWQQEV